MSAGLVIVGGCYAGLQAAASAREAGYQEPIQLISDEKHPPYQRPPLSKAFLLGKVDASLLPLRGDAFYSDSRVDLLLGTRVAAIDRRERSLVIEGGAAIPYHRLVLATGARPRLLPVPGAELDGVVVLRTLDDAHRLRERIAASGSAVVIGAGFIGLEVAAVLATLGKQVTVIEALDRVLARSAAPPLADFVAAFHRRKGVTLRLGAAVSAIEGAAGRVVAVTCRDGTRDAADLVIVAIGILPNLELAEASGLSCANGIVVNAFARTSDSDVFAAGDCTAHPNAFASGPIRLESVQNAIDQAKTAGASVAGLERPYDAVPWFWSDQYELKLQTAGLHQGHDAHAIRGSLEEGRFSICYFRAGTLIAVDSVNRPADHMLARKLVAARVRLTPEQATDAGFDLRSALPAQGDAVKP